MTVAQRIEQISLPVRHHGADPASLSTVHELAAACSPVSYYFLVNRDRGFHQGCQLFRSNEDIAMSGTTHRRDFLAQSTACATLGLAASLGGVHAAGPTRSTVRLALIGCGGIMTHHAKGLVSRKDDVSFEWLCDVDRNQIRKMARVIDGFQSTPARQTQDYQKVLEDPRVDACIIATPHHWHAPIALRAMQAGKDVYVEKPISHVYNEGPLMAQAARRYGRVVQQGSQMRSSPVTKKAEKLLRSGILGEIKVARAWTAEIRSVVKPVADSEPPAGVDYDRWLGPAEGPTRGSLLTHPSSRRQPYRP